MSTNIRVALETALKAVSATFDTAWENWPYTPRNGVPYQKVNLLLAEPDNSEYGSNYREQGIFQVTLMYPLQTGVKDSTNRAEVLRDTFKRGAAFSSGGTVVVVDRTPEVVIGGVNGDRWSVAVKVRWHAQVQ